MSRQRAVPTFDQLMWPTLKALRLMGGSATNDELLAKVIEIEGVPEDIASVIHSDNRQTKLAYNLAWARTYLRRVGALDNSARGVWAITEAGEQMDATAVQSVPAIVRKRDYEQRCQEVNGEPETQVDRGDQSEVATLSWKDVLLGSLRKIDPSAFERLAQRILRESGFVKVEVTGRSGDGGIDGIGVLRLNLLSFQVLFQCKRYTASVGASEIRNFRGAMIGRSDKGLFITTGTFSTEAKKEATRDGAPPIDLVDGDQLCDLLKALKLGVRTELVESVVIDEEWISKI